MLVEGLTYSIIRRRDVSGTKLTGLVELRENEQQIPREIRVATQLIDFLKKTTKRDNTVIM